MLWCIKMLLKGMQMKALLTAVTYILLCCRDSDRSLDIFDEKSHPLTVNLITLVWLDCLSASHMNRNKPWSLGNWCLFQLAYKESQMFRKIREISCLLASVQRNISVHTKLDCYLASYTLKSGAAECNPWPIGPVLHSGCGARQLIQVLFCWKSSVGLL